MGPYPPPLYFSKKFPVVEKFRTMVLLCIYWSPKIPSLFWTHSSQASLHHSSPETVHVRVTNPCPRCKPKGQFSVLFLSVGSATFDIIDRYFLLETLPLLGFKDTTFSHFSRLPHLLLLLSILCWFFPPQKLNVKSSPVSSPYTHSLANLMQSHGSKHTSIR